MTATQLRAALRRVREDRGWTFQQFAADIHRTNGFQVVSEATVRNFLAGSRISPRIESALRLYLDKHSGKAA